MGRTVVGTDLGKQFIRKDESNRSFGLDGLKSLIFARINAPKSFISSASFSPSITSTPITRSNVRRSCLIVPTDTVSGVTRQTVVKGTGSDSSSSSTEVGNEPNNDKCISAYNNRITGDPNAHHRVALDGDHSEPRLAPELRGGKNQR